LEVNAVPLPIKKIKELRNKKKKLHFSNEKRNKIRR
jgi:hypothetical protein